MVDGHMYPVRVIQETAQLITGRIVCVWEEKASIGFQGVVIPIGTVVTAATVVRLRLCMVVCVVRLFIVHCYVIGMYYINVC